MEYRSFSDLNAAVKRWSQQLPKDFDLIVGVPRSGLMPANMLSLYWNLPLTDIEGLLHYRLLDAGKQLKKRKTFPDLSKSQRVLVVDDSLLSGNQMRAVKSKIEAAKLPHIIEYAAVYMSPKSTRYVDYWYELVEPPRVFEWNMMHFVSSAKHCVDIDGVLCRDPTRYENDDGERYRHFMENVEPLVVPSSQIGWLVTSRLERYRASTEEWLEKHEIRYKQLLMLDLPSRKSRRLSRTHAILHKAEVYENCDAHLFIESSSDQAGEIADRAGKPVYCVETGTMVCPGTMRRSKSALSYFFRNVGRAPFKTLASSGRAVMRRAGYSVLTPYAMITRKRKRKKRRVITRKRKRKKRRVPA